MSKIWGAVYFSDGLFFLANRFEHKMTAEFKMPDGRLIVEPKPAQPFFSDGLYTAQNAVPESDAVRNFRHFQSGVFVFLPFPEGFHDVDVEAGMFAHGGGGTT